ncbi:hypothetical protein [Actinomadura keratinilytica]|uniref:hypothetical protein n=1 Tax=Actinomadura keratinilytica TaxID=547461 RepID=UPI00361C91B2
MGGRDNDPERTEESLVLLREWLHAEAERHEPDRERIWARIEAAMDRPAETIAAGGAHSGGDAGHGRADGRGEDGAAAATRSSRRTTPSGAGCARAWRPWPRRASSA